MTFRVPPRLAYYTVEPAGSAAPDVSRLTVFLRRVPGGPTLVLVDAGGLIWQLASQGVVDVPAVVAGIVEEPLDEIRAEVEDYLDSLVSQGLLEPVRGLDPSPRKRCS